ncbi:MAG: hypothetical protein JXA61_03875 [Bacteroidales bacterium]|nr:hypothetical protein [Bacteroidales bacterium]
MKIAISMSLIFLCVNAVYTQNFDLLVKSNGDSIACRIDSITSTQYFFEMRINGAWVHTHINKENVIKYDSNVVNKKNTDFMPGTSIITHKKGIRTDSYPGTTFYIELGGKGYCSANIDFRLKQNHRVSLFLSVNDYVVWDISENSSETKKLSTAGFMYNYIKGKSKSFFELGIGISTSVRLDLKYDEMPDTGYKGSPLNIHGFIGYRYQKPNGLLFRAGLTPLYNLGNFPLPILGISIGYSF